MPNAKENKESTIASSFISHLRQQSRVPCPVPGCNEQLAAIDDRIQNHFTAKHPQYIEGKDINTLIRDVKRGRKPSAVETPISTRDPGGGNSGSPAAADQGGPSTNKRRKSPMPSPAKPARARSNSPIRRSRARPQPNPTPHDPDFSRGAAQQQGKLWNPDNDPSPSASRTKPSSSRPAKAQVAPRVSEPPEDDSEVRRMIKQPETRPISQEQLVAEVKGIYAGLMMVEAKCIEVDNAQSSQNDTRLNNEQWQALIALHRTLLHEHHDFFLASQHPSASQALKRLASKYAMPARMWRHGIHSFLELLRHRLPGSLEHMLTFIYLAYSMMALLYETVPAFEDTWIECLGDLGRYRMAIEDEDIRDREVWTSVSRHWYSKASDKVPTTGRLYHHLAILARPNALQQLYYYAKSLCVPIPFASAKESIMTLFDPILSGHAHGRMMPIDVAFVRTHGILFSRKQSERFEIVANEFLESLNTHIHRITKRWMEAGYYIAIANCCALLSYGKEQNAMMKLIHHYNDESKGQNQTRGLGPLKPSADFEDALHLTMGTHEVVLRRHDDVNVLAYTHVVMVFMFYLTRVPDALSQLEHRFPWKLLSLMLNNLLDPAQDNKRMCSDEFPRESNEPLRPVPEDFALKGLLFVDQYYPADWFSNERIDDEEKYFEMPSMVQVRKERILWLGYKIAQSGRGLTYDHDTSRFGVLPEFEREIDEISRDADMMNIADDAGSQTTSNPVAVETGAGDAMDIDTATTTTTASTDELS
ncbi:hypothetical protein F4808DRAFT_36463 [Astrocystis sublimbata]|nr:hypothetical protein F4808DRAFT_36463 [Astrocystis sublimbata]